MLTTLRPPRLLLPALLLVTAACNGATDSHDPGGGKTDDLDGAAIPVEIGEPAAGFEVDIEAASLEGDILTLTLRHGGGCGDHDYHIYWDGSFLETSPMMAALSVRDETDDFCEALLVREASFDLSAMREAAGTDEGRVALSIDNFAGEAPLYEWGASAAENGITIGEPPRDSDGFELEMARIEDGKLLVDVSYGGGCQEHEFTLYWDGSVIETFPAQVDLVLFHDAHGDFCEAFLSETLEFDLAELEEIGSVVINLDGFEGPLSLE